MEKQYERLVATLRWNEMQQDRVAANELLRQLAEYHRKRVAKNDRFMLRCTIETKEGIMDKKTLAAVRKEALSQRDWFHDAVKEEGISGEIHQYRSGSADAYGYIINLIDEMLESC